LVVYSLLFLALDLQIECMAMPPRTATITPGAYASCASTVIDSIFVTGTSVDSFLFAPTKTTPLKIPGFGD